MSLKSVNPNPNALTEEPYLGGFILETLTVGMYTESRNAIREYLQNGLDAIRLAISQDIIKSGQGRIDIQLEKNSLSIRDNGAGISSDIAASVLTAVGASTKTYKKEAGFRGIGRLAGIAFCDKLTFTTQAQNEKLRTSVIFDAKGLRQDMTPGKGEKLSLSGLLLKHITAKVQPHPLTEPFFEVKIEGFYNAPKECLSATEMIKFVSQVAPVPYSPEFPFTSEILSEAKRRSFDIEHVHLFVTSAAELPIEVYKPYGAKFGVGRTSVPLSKCSIYDPPSKRWWAWIGKKEQSGAFRDDRERGLRVRIRNIQIDGTQIMGQVFSNHIEGTTSFGRFNDWYLGEIFVDPTYLIPNARRDGFEENANWDKMQGELAKLAKDLGGEAYELSRKGQYSIKTLLDDTRKLEREVEPSRKSEPVANERLIELANEVTKAQRRVSRALKSADLETASQLRSLENRLLDVKTRAVQKLGVVASYDPETIRLEAQKEVISELMTAFRQQLDPPTYSRVSKIAVKVLGTDEF